MKKKRKNKHRPMKILIGVILSLIVFCLLDIFASYHWLVVRNTTIPVAGQSRLQEDTDIRICVISDLHNASFGKSNEKLVREIQKQKPDLILIAGDMLNEDSKDDTVPVVLVKSLVKIAPVCYALGNHEIGYMNMNRTKEQGTESGNNGQKGLLQNLRNAGAKVLERNYVDITVKKRKIRVGGMYEYAFGQTDTGNEASAAPENVRNFLTKFDNTSAYKIMICHRPDSFVFGDAATYWHPDLIISGHDHGGQVVIPFLGGLFGGDQGWFPEYVHGLHKIGNTRIFITSGLGSQKEKLPRFNNRPEIAMLTLK